MTAKSLFTDGDKLRMLDLSAAGYSSYEIGQQFGIRSETVRTILQRIRAETEPSEHDGTMPARWWQEGLEAR